MTSDLFIVHFCLHTKLLLSFMFVFLHFIVTFFYLIGCTIAFFPHLNSVLSLTCSIKYTVAY